MNFLSRLFLYPLNNFNEWTHSRTNRYSENFESILYEVSHTSFGITLLAFVFGIIVYGFRLWKFALFLVMMSPDEVSFTWREFKRDILFITTGSEVNKSPT